MKLKELLQNVQVLEATADMEKNIDFVTSDSRQVTIGSLFVAISGFATDGNRYIPMALEKGAVAVVTAKKPEADIPYVLVEDDRLALARIGTNYYGHPAEKMIMVGVTGTNGKTSVTTLLKQVLQQVTGEKVGLVGTMENHIGDVVEEASRTTPESIELQKLFARMVNAGCKYAVMEVSSHAIALHRVEGIRFAVAGFTNLTEDHLDFHETMEAYGATKAQLFAHCDRAVTNADSTWGQPMVAACKGEVISVSQKGMGDLCAENVAFCADGVKFDADCGEKRVPVAVPIPGKFTVYNVLTVLALAKQLGVDMEKAAAALRCVEGVKGRVEVVPTPGTDYTILIDYAHTPDGLENVLSSVRGFCKGRLIAVFGCGGDRDRTKRPIMGQIGVRLADLAVITSDNPRTEVPADIIADIVAGTGDAKNKIIIENRVQAIHYAMDIGKKDDIIVLAGKGHETYQEIMHVKHHLDEREVVAAYLQEKR